MTQKTEHKDENHRMDFEAGLKRLEEIVECLEKQDLPLEEAVRLFEEGMKISKRCARLLEQAEERIKVLIRDEKSGEIKEQDLEPLDQDLSP